MTTGVALRLVACGALCLVLAGCGGPTHTYRYRLTVTVNVGGIPHTGSSVVDVTLQEGSAIDQHYSSQRLSGEATVVDLGRGRRLVAAFEPPQDYYSNPYAHIHDHANLGWSGASPILLQKYGFDTNWLKDSSVLDQLAEQHGAKDLQPNELPKLIAFRDATRPETAMVVDPNDLAATLGPGVSLGRVTIEVTQDAVTRDIDGLLPWLAAARDGQPLCGAAVRCYKSYFTRAYWPEW